MKCSFKALTWNCEGLKTNIFFLKNLLNTHNPIFASISEPQIYQCDVSSILQYLGEDYCWFLNSHDLQDPELPLVKSRAQGGTLMLWRNELDPFIEEGCGDRTVGHQSQKDKSGQDPNL